MANNTTVDATMDPLIPQFINVTEIPSIMNNTSTNNCGEFLYDFHQDIGLTIVFGLCFLLGLVLIFAGYRLFRFSLFLHPFSLVSVIVYQVLSHFAVLPLLYTGLASAGSGIAAGLIAVFIKTIGMFGLSLVQGVFIGTCGLYVVNVFILDLTNAFIPPTVVLVCFVFLAIPTIKFEKAMTIFYTASYGTVLIMLSVDYFLNLSMLRNLGYELLISVKHSYRTEPCWFSWILFGLWPIMVILGCLVQLLKTGKYYDHKSDECCCCRKQKEPSVHLLSSKNDVISKQWIYGPSTPSQKGERDEEEVFLMDDVTPV